MKRLNIKAIQSGLTLIELLVAMTIGLFMLLAIALVYSTSKTGFSYANNTVRMTEDASFALDVIGRDIRMASYAGCTGSNVRTSGTPAVEYYTPKLDTIATQTVNGNSKPNPFSGVVGGNLLQLFSSKNAVWGFAANDTAAIGVLGGSASTYQPSTTMPMLYLAGGSTQALQVNAAVATAASDIPISADTYKWANNSSLFMIISDCKASEVFRSTSVLASGAIYNVAHAATRNDSANLANTYGSDAMVMPLTTSVYFIATRSKATTPSLYRRSFNGETATFEELVTNVEAITFHYGVNDTSVTAAGEPTYRADNYITSPASVADWSKVVSVRIGLIMVSEDLGKAIPNSSGTATPIKWIGADYTPPNDSRLRRSYSTTVSIRNRMGL